MSDVDMKEHADSQDGAGEEEEEQEIVEFKPYSHLTLMVVKSC